MGSHPTRPMTSRPRRGSTKGKKEIHEGTRRTTKDHEGTRSEMNLLQRHAPQLGGAGVHPPTASAFAWRLGFCDSPSRGE